ncbi:hypothetical protein [Streptomyces sp. TRM70350]|uniref:hypothetical protein n=1 Tax=Streptomyces sp. TRM70350 TaxID=2856165 RepID=UPI001C48CBD8|nr:hypothetical protein [Streptomyces sp. TRM70350]MBV7695849.1 hypothetical protein [Streptomyces sp. TRM70350]
MAHNAMALTSAFWQAAPDGAHARYAWWLLIGGCVVAAAALLVSVALFRAHRKHDVGILDTACRIAGDIAAWGLFVAFMGGAGWLIEMRGAAPTPSTSTSAFLVLLASTAGIAVVLAGCLALTFAPFSNDLERTGQPLPQLVAGYALVVDVVIAVMAALGALRVTHLSLIETVAWAHVGVGLAPLAVGFILLFVFLVASA